jgi:hypothetical protein
MELDFVPTRTQIEAARLSIELSESIDRPIADDIRAIAAWPLGEAADAPRRNAS